VKSFVKHETSHDKCVAISITISTSFAHLKEILSRANLKRILNLIFDIILSIFLTNYDCYNLDVL